MQLLIRALSSTFAVSVPETATVGDLKQAVEDYSFFPSETQVLRRGTTGLSANATALCEYGVQHEDTVTLLFDVDGGMRAKWRKKRMRRLRRKRRKMRMRAR